MLFLYATKKIYVQNRIISAVCKWHAEEKECICSNPHVIFIVVTGYYVAL